MNPVLMLLGALLLALAIDLLFDVLLFFRR